jgi:hypothetical protein
MHLALRLPLHLAIDQFENLLVARLTKLQYLAFPSAGETGVICQLLGLYQTSDQLPTWHLSTLSDIGRGAE